MSNVEETWIQELILGPNCCAMLNQPLEAGGTVPASLSDAPLRKNLIVDPFLTGPHFTKLRPGLALAIFVLKFAMFQLISFVPLPFLPVSPSLRLRILPFLC
jgi:hypothetical protein